MNVTTNRPYITQYTTFTTRKVRIYHAETARVDVSFEYSY